MTTRSPETGGIMLASYAGRVPTNTESIRHRAAHPGPARWETAMSDYGTIGHHRLAAISDLDRSIIRQRIRRVEHNLMVYPRPKMDAPGLFGGICTCGDWESAPGSVREVASSWEQHQEAKTSVDSG